MNAPTAIEVIAALPDEALIDHTADACLRDDEPALAVRPLLIAEWNRRHPEDPWSQQ